MSYHVTKRHGCSTLWFSQWPKSKNKQVGLYQARKILHSKGNHQQNGKTTYRMGKNILGHKLSDWKGIKIKNIQTVKNDF